jgi:Taurine catabolism dioxygenase TauD, TfdA family
MKIVPEAGGDTGFASMYAAYDALSNRMKTYLEGLTATHDGHATFSRYNPGGSYPRAVHPVINTHPVSGRKGIYVNRGFTIHINELPDDEGDALLAFLFDHCERPNWSTRFHWQEDTVAFWDNRCVPASMFPRRGWRNGSHIDEYRAWVDCVDCPAVKENSRTTGPLSRMDRTNCAPRKQSLGVSATRAPNKASCSVFDFVRFQAEPH